MLVFVGEEVVVRFGRRSSLIYAKTSTGCGYGVGEDEIRKRGHVWHSGLSHILFSTSACNTT